MNYFRLIILLTVLLTTGSSFAFFFGTKESRAFDKHLVSFKHQYQHERAISYTKGAYKDYDEELSEKEKIQAQYDRSKLILKVLGLDDQYVVSGKQLVKSDYIYARGPEGVTCGIRKLARDRNYGANVNYGQFSSENTKLFQKMAIVYNTKCFDIKAGMTINVDVSLAQLSRLKTGN